jgi:hypothetical protein
MKFDFAEKMEDLCQDILNAKKDRTRRCKETVQDILNAKKDRTRRCKEIVQETHNFLEGFRRDFLFPVRQDFQAASATFKKFAKEFSRVH